MNTMKKLLAWLCCAMLLPSFAWAEEPEAPILEIHQMQIGFADGYFIRLGDLEIMIDGGKPVPYARNDDVPRILREIGATKLDAYIITHWHLDHCENVNVVLSEFGTPDTVVYSPAANVHVDFAPLANGVYKQMKMDDVIYFGDLVLTCTGPEKVSKSGGNNVDSLNFLLTYGTRRMFFTGDYAHSALISKKYNEFLKDVDLLKFPHHANEPYEIRTPALKILSPEYILIPSQINNYNVYKLCTGNRIDIQRENILTERMGHVVIMTDGGELFEAHASENPADFAPKAQ